MSEAQMARLSRMVELRKLVRNRKGAVLRANRRIGVLRAKIYHCDYEIRKAEAELRQMGAKL